jgi:formyltetrahydrofolate deformylase
MRAYERGVKMIGATAHYATADLDQGPIIEQDVERVTHEDTVEGLQAIGRDVERVVLCRAVKAHLEHRILVSNNRTVVFSAGV